MQIAQNIADSGIIIIGTARALFKKKELCFLKENSVKTRQMAPESYYCGNFLEKSFPAPQLIKNSNLEA